MWFHEKMCEIIDAAIFSTWCGLTEKYGVAEIITFSSGDVFSAAAAALMEFSVLAILAVRPSRRLVILSVSSTCNLYLSHSLGAADCMTLTVTPRPSSSLAFVSALRLACSLLSRDSILSRPVRARPFASSTPAPSSAFVDLWKRREIMKLSINLFFNRRRVVFTLCCQKCLGLTQGSKVQMWCAVCRYLMMLQFLLRKKRKCQIFQRKKIAVCYSFCADNASTITPCKTFDALQFVESLLFDCSYFTHLKCTLDNGTVYWRAGHHLLLRNTDYKYPRGAKSNAKDLPDFSARLQIIICRLFEHLSIFAFWKKRHITCPE